MGKGKGSNSSEGANWPPDGNGGAGERKQPGRAGRLTARDPWGSKAEVAPKSKPGVTGEGDEIHYTRNVI